MTLDPGAARVRKERAFCPKLPSGQRLHGLWQVPGLCTSQASLSGGGLGSR